jgi:hypothetical protein
VIRQGLAQIHPDGAEDYDRRKTVALEWYLLGNSILKVAGSRHLCGYGTEVFAVFDRRNIATI